MPAAPPAVAPPRAARSIGQLPHPVPAAPLTPPSPRRRLPSALRSFVALLALNVAVLGATVLLASLAVGSARTPARAPTPAGAIARGSMPPPALVLTLVDGSTHGRDVAHILGARIHR